MESSSMAELAPGRVIALEAVQNFPARVARLAHFAQDHVRKAFPARFELPQPRMGFGRDGDADRCHALRDTQTIPPDKCWQRADESKFQGMAQIRWGHRAAMSPPASNGWNDPLRASGCAAAARISPWSRARITTIEPRSAGTARARWWLDRKSVGIGRNLPPYRPADRCWCGR